MVSTRLNASAFGATGLDITRVGLGAWAIGGAGYDWGWGTQDDDDSIAAIHRALEPGVNWIDAAAHMTLPWSSGCAQSRTATA
jgi:aryl-alcohol dehydrogenase-like predicted oxidoreductase